LLALRIVLGLSLVASAGGFAVLAWLALGFRRSFGASRIGTFFVAAPLLVAALFLTSLVFDDALPLLHIAAGVALVLAGLCVAGARKIGPLTAGALLLWLALWGCYYASAAWGLAAVEPGR
jgi:hypothetical protein